MNSLSFSEQNLVNLEITNTYENLQIVWSQFFTGKQIFIYIWSNSNKYLLVYRYSDLMPMNTNEELFGYIWLFVIFDHQFDEQIQR